MIGEESVDVVVVGAGVAGAAAACELSRRGHRTALCEQYQMDHVMGSSHGRSRIFRLAYDSPDYVELARQARDLWRSLEERSGTNLLHQTGGLDIGTRDELEATCQALTDADAPFERLSGSVAADRSLPLKVPDGWEVIFQPDAGVICAKEALDTFRSLALESGAHLLHHSRVLSLVEESDHIGVETDTGALRAETVVVTAGGWANRLLQPLDLPVPLRVTREHVAYYPSMTGHPSLPFIWHTPDAPQVYGLPRRPGETTTKVGRHVAGEVVEPGGHTHADASSVDLITAFVRESAPGLRPHPLLAETCLYSSSPDDDFVLDRSGRVVMGVGLGGHGFKFGPVIGAMLADLVEDKPINFAPRFSRRRFGVLSSAG